MAFGTQVFALPESVTQARQRAEDLTGVAGRYEAQEASISDILRQKVQELYADNQDIIRPLDEAIAAYYSAPATARDQYQGIFNPFSREKLVSQYVTQALRPVLSLSGILGQRMGRIEDYIGAGTRAFEAESARKKAEAEQARKQYESALDEYLQTEQLRQQERQLDISEYTARKPTGSGVTSTAGEREQSRLLQSLTADIRRGLGVADIAFRYRDSGLEVSDILNTYDSLSPYGPHKESLDELSLLFGFTQPADPFDLLMEQALREAGLVQSTSGTLR